MIIQTIVRMVIDKQKEIWELNIILLVEGGTIWFIERNTGRHIKRFAEFRSID